MSQNVKSTVFLQWCETVRNPDKSMAESNFQTDTQGHFESLPLEKNARGYLYEPDYGKEDPKQIEEEAEEEEAAAAAAAKKRAQPVSEDEERLGTMQDKTIVDKTTKK